MPQIGPDLRRRRHFSLPDTFSKTSQFQHLEGYGDGHMFIQEVLEQAQAKLEQAQITTICAVNDNQGQAAPPNFTGDIAPVKSNAQSLPYRLTFNL